MELTNKQNYQYLKAVLLELLKLNLISGLEFVELINKIKATCST